MAVDAKALAEEIASRVEALPVQNVPSVRAVRREYTKRLKNEVPKDIVKLAKELYRRKRIHRFVADELITYHKGALATLSERDVVAFGRSMASWDQVDCYGGYISGPAWRTGIIDDKLVVSWTESPDRWWRRAALVSTVALNREESRRGDARRTLAVCERLLDDRDDMVVKAMSWALRALAARDPAAVRRFIDRHRARLAARAVRETENKLRTGLKNPKPAER